MNALRNYFQDLSGGLGRAWNRFWFTPTDPMAVSALRLLTGLMAFGYLLSHTADLTRWFGSNGLLTIPTVARLTGVGNPDAHVYRESIFYYIDQPAVLCSVHLVALAVALMCAAGLFTRTTTILTFLFVLSYVHRAPMLTGQWEPLLTMMLLYLCLAPAGRELSVDGWLRRRRGEREPALASVAATVSVRLMQVHAAMFYLMFGLTKLAGEPWWDGDAVWWLMAHTESRLVDFSFIARSGAWLVFNLWTYAIVAYELLFAIFIWNRLAKPLLLAAGVLIWLSLIPLTGLAGYAVMMLVVNAAFIPSSWWRVLATPSPTPSRISERTPQPA